MERCPVTDSDPRQAHWDLLGSLFAPDALFAARVVSAGVAGPDDARVEGRAAIVAKLVAIWELLGSTHHMISNHQFELGADGRMGQGSCYVRAHHVGAAERAHLFEESLGRFDYATILEDRAWRIRRWEENIFVILGDPAVFGGR